MKNILIIDNSLHITGALKSIIEVTSGLESNNLTFITPSISNKQMLESLGFKTYRFHLFELQKNWKIILYIPFLILNLMLLLRVIKKHQISIVHSNDLYNMLGVLVQFFSPVKLIYHIRLLRTSYVGSLYNVWAYLIARYSDRIIFVSKAVRIDFGKTDKGVVIYDAMNFEKNFCPERPNDRKKIKFIYPSNFILGKGQQYALESFSLVCNEFPNIELTFIGGTMNKNSNIKFKSKLVVEAKKRNIFHKINFLDFTNNILEEICKHDVVLMFSESESYSMVCLEAAALKKPIIATKCGGPSEIIVNNYSGFLVDNKNIDEMCKAMKTLINDYSLCKEMGNEAYKYCREKFSISEGRKRILEVYESV